MKVLKFECTLRSNVILNQSTATEGTNATLDFIPGNCFLGIVAKHYKDFKDDALEVFHSGRVRFGDAHPVCIGHENTRALRVPAAIFYPKQKDISESYVFHLYDRNKDKENNGRPQQLKQCRKEFYAFEELQAFSVNTEKSFAVKSAYDRELRRAKDEEMYCYESLNKGARFLFEVEIDEDKFADKIKNFLIGEHYIGRSRSAQYGTVDIQEHNYENIPSRKNQADYVTVYADGRLIFLAPDGETTFRPTAEMLGIPGGIIDWERSQIRTFQYAPWNGLRSTRDTDRCGIEKGSVFVVECSQTTDFTSKYVGSYKNEGFGKVIYNPYFLESNGENGKTSINFIPNPQDTYCQNNKTHSCNTTAIIGDTPLLRFILQKEEEDKTNNKIYELVNKFVKSNSEKFRNDEKFAAQWGQIRNIAMQSSTNIKADVIEYVEHGVAEEKWRKNKRKDTLEKFMEKFDDKNIAKALINLASEMAKKCK